MQAVSFTPPIVKSHRADAAGQAMLFPWLHAQRPTTTIPAIAGSPTSRRAVRRVSMSATSVRARMLQLFASRGAFGVTDEEGAAALRVSQNSYRPRRIQLVREGLLADSGRCRNTVSGCAATVWRAAP